MLTGMAVTHAALVWAAASLDSGLLPPLMLSLVGLAIGTVGFVRYAIHDHRTRFIRPLRRPNFRVYWDGYTMPKE